MTYHCPCCNSALESATQSMPRGAFVVATCKSDGCKLKNYTMTLEQMSNPAMLALYKAEKRFDVYTGKMEQPV